jgi:DNA (cytosine-5)-methyltransferase 1
MHRRKVESAMQAGTRKIGCIYKRMRENENGERVQRAEVRFDNISGCLRTPVGGSSRQTLIFIDHGRIRTRLLAPREAARLMGLPESYALPEKYNEAYHLAGDGVVVPVVRFLSVNLLGPLLGIRAEKYMGEPQQMEHDEQFALLK